MIMTKIIFDILFDDIVRITRREVVKHWLQCPWITGKVTIVIIIRFTKLNNLSIILIITTYE